MMNGPLLCHSSHARRCEKTPSHTPHGGERTITLQHVGAEGKMRLKSVRGWIEHHGETTRAQGMGQAIGASKPPCLPPRVLLGTGGTRRSGLDLFEKLGAMLERCPAAGAPVDRVQGDYPARSSASLRKHRLYSSSTRFTSSADRRSNSRARALLDNLPLCCRRNCAKTLMVFSGMSAVSS